MPSLPKCFCIYLEKKDLPQFYTKMQDVSWHVLSVSLLVDDREKWDQNLSNICRPQALLFTPDPAEVERADWMHPGARLSGFY